VLETVFVNGPVELYTTVIPVLNLSGGLNDKLMLELAAITMHLTGTTAPSAGSAELLKIITYPAVPALTTFNPYRFPAPAFKILEPERTVETEGVRLVPLVVVGAILTYRT
jgi:hypothetical protein